MPLLPSLLRRHEVYHLFGGSSAKLTPEVTDTLPHLVLPGDVRYPRDYMAALKSRGSSRTDVRMRTDFIAGFATSKVAAELTLEAIQFLDDELNLYTYGETIQSAHVKTVLNIGARTLKGWLDDGCIEDAKDGPDTIVRASLDAALDWHVPQAMKLPTSQV